MATTSSIIGSMAVMMYADQLGLWHSPLYDVTLFWTLSSTSLHTLMKLKCRLTDRKSWTIASIMFTLNTWNWYLSRKFASWTCWTWSRCWTCWTCGAGWTGFTCWTGFRCWTCWTCGAGFTCWTGWTGFSCMIYTTYTSCWMHILIHMDACVYRRQALLPAAELWWLRIPKTIHLCPHCQLLSATGEPLYKSVIWMHTLNAWVYYAYTEWWHVYVAQEETQYACKVLYRLK